MIEIQPYLDEYYIPNYIGQTDYFHNSYQIDDLIADSPFLSFLKTHAQWLSGKLKLPCIGTRDMVF
jgi:hypothetical protein